VGGQTSPAKDRKSSKKAGGSPDTLNQDGTSVTECDLTQYALRAGFVQKFEILGLANLLHLQTEIKRQKSKLFPKSKAPDNARGAGAGDNTVEETGEDINDDWILDEIMKSDFVSQPEFDCLMTRLQQYSVSRLSQ
jgi:hypothetical protein